MESNNKSYPQTAYPPFSAISVLVAVTGLCFSCVPHMMKSLDSVATIETISSSLFISYISHVMLGWIRLGITVLMLLVTVIRVKRRANPLVINYLKESKLRQLPIDVSGLRSLMMFTCLSWNVLAISFGLNATLTLLHRYGYVKIFHPWILRLAIITFEIAAPTSMLVSAVVRYVLWPAGLKGKGTDALKLYDTLFQHNANVFLSLLEVGLLGGLPIRLEDWFVAPLYGVSYVLFSWFMIHRLVPSKEPQCLYFFLDPTLGSKCAYSLLALMIVLVASYGLFTVVDDVMIHLGGGIFVHSLVILGVSSLVCRFRD